MLILTKDFSKSSYRASQVMLVVKNLPANTGDIRDAGLIPGLGWSRGGGNGNPLQHSCLENPMDRGAWWAMGLQGVGHSWGRELDRTEHVHTHTNRHVHTHTHTHKSSCRRHGLSYFIIDFSSWTQSSFQSFFHIFFARHIPYFSDSHNIVFFPFDEWMES